MLDFVVRRGLEHAGGIHVLKRSLSSDKPADFPVWGAVLLGVTAVGFLIFLTVVEYALYYLIATLAATETPGTAITISAPKEAATGEEKEGLLETSPETTLVREKPITSSIRATLKHLRAEHGRMALLKGYGYHLLYFFAHSWVLNMFLLVVPRNTIFSMIAAGAAGAICAPLHAAWTNKVISKSSDITFRQRFPGRSGWKALALPAAIYAVLPYMMFFIVLGFGFLYDYNSPRRGMGLMQLIAVVFGVSAAMIFVWIPVMATLVRTEASLLSEDQDTIIPFDRTFAGKLVPVSLGGTGTISFMDAWRSFDGEGRRRVFKHFVKSFFIVSFVVLIMAHAFLFELFLILGTSFGPKMKEAFGHPN